MKRVAIYARVSTTGKGQDVEMQLRDLRSYVEARGWEMFKEYLDDGVSGRKDKRPSLDAMMNDARQKRFDVVLVWRFDRFARSTKHLINSLDEFNHLGIDFVSFQENVDTSSPMGKMVFTITSAFAELEASIIRERVVAGIANARAKGVKLGRPSPLVNRDELLQLRGRGLAIREIATRMNLDKMLVCKTLKKCDEIPVRNQGVVSQEMRV